MRTDHFAFQQATRVAGIGLLLQAALGLVLLIWGAVGGDTAFEIAATYILPGCLVWIGLVVVFHQHRLERLESLERDELAASREEGTGLFDEGDVDVGARRLRLMHTWLMPVISLLVVVLLVLFSWRTLVWFGSLDDPNLDIAPFSTGTHPGWQLAIALALSLLAFIFSRFVAGMANQPAWQNLRGGAGYMVGNALVLLALAVGITFRFFDKPEVLEGIGYGLSIYMLLVAAEIVLNFVLNLYRPRRPGEVPRPAFDSRVLSLFAAPDSIVRSINEAVNYQFGFDITSSWGYQLLLRSFAWLIAFGVIVLFLLSTIVIVEPGQQGVRLRGGRIVGEVYEGRVMLKWPWPFESSEVVDTARIREISLNGTPRKEREVIMWDPQEEPRQELFLVAASKLPNDLDRAIELLLQATGSLDAITGDDPAADAAAEDGLTNQFALIDADVILRYRVKSGGLVEYLSFSNDIRPRRSLLNMRQQTLRDMALRVVTQTMSTMPLDEVLSPKGSVLPTELRGRVQKAFDDAVTGIEVISLAIPALRPPGQAASMVEELSIDTQNTMKVLEEARRETDGARGAMVGSVARAHKLAAAITAYNELVAKTSIDDPAVVEARVRIERMLEESRGAISWAISAARMRRWQIHMEARGNAAEVLGQVGSYSAAPRIYRERRIMRVLGETLGLVRAKYVLGVDPSRTKFDVDMQEPDSGLDLGRFLSDPEDES
jgi:regulator of protease activity HflC (stomatin/prohibitin superfamily)